LPLAISTFKLVSSDGAAVVESVGDIVGKNIGNSALAGAADAVADRSVKDVTNSVTSVNIKPSLRRAFVVPRMMREILKRIAVLKNVRFWYCFLMQPMPHFVRKSRFYP
jgi:hypothetical protein